MHRSVVFFSRGFALCSFVVLGACDLSNAFSFLSSRSTAVATAPAASSGGAGRATSVSRSHTTAFAASSAPVAPAAPAFGNFSFSRSESHTETHTTGPAARSHGLGAEQAPAGPTCNGDWTLGSMPMTCSNCGLGQACNNANAPTNCADGMYIRMGDDCRCIARCSSFGVELGQSCAQGWTCRHIRATNASANRSTVCVPDQWNLCQGDPNAPSSSRRRSLRDDD